MTTSPRAFFRWFFELLRPLVAELTPGQVQANDVHLEKKNVCQNRHGLSKIARVPHGVRAGDNLRLPQTASSSMEAGSNFFFCSLAWQLSVLFNILPTSWPNSHGLSKIARVSHGVRAGGNLRLPQTADTKTRA